MTTITNDKLSNLLLAIAVRTLWDEVSSMSNSDKLAELANDPVLDATEEQILEAVEDLLIKYEGYLTAREQELNPESDQ